MAHEWNEFLTDQGLVADRSHFGHPQDELREARDAAVVSPLIDLGVIRATGEDAANFLHNLVSNDINGIAEHNARFAGLCTPKGRLLALLLVWREGTDLLLLLPRDILPTVLKRLSMYVLRSKVKLTDATAERPMIGYAVPSTAPPVPEAAGLPRFGLMNVGADQLIRLDPTRWLWVCAPGTASERWATQIRLAKPVGLSAWHWLEIAAGQPRVVAATQEAFVPQMLNMELPAVAGVSFTKGCYPGQEIVARTQYLGKIKRRTYRARIDTPFDALTTPPTQPGTHVYAPETGDQPCGSIVSVAASPDGGYEALVCVQNTAVEAGVVHLGSTDGARLLFLPLPYELG